MNKGNFCVQTNNGGVHMDNKNTKSKNKKGFYTALGISFAMVLAACIYSFYQTDEEEDFSSMEATNVSVEEATFEEAVPEIIATETICESTETEEFQQAAAIKNDSETEISEDEEETESIEESAHIISLPLGEEREVLQSFSNGELIKDESEGCWKTHNGTDFSATKGDKVFAADSGVVKSIGEEGLWGITITIDHENGYVTKYTGLGNDISVNEGDRVESNQQIGCVGDNPESENQIKPHFHFEVLNNEKYIDPEEYLAG